MTQEKLLATLSKRIDSLRKERGLSFQKMADVCDIDKAQAYKMCREPMDIRVSTLLKLSKGFEVSITELFNTK